MVTCTRLIALAPSVLVVCNNGFFHRKSWDDSLLLHVLCLIALAPSSFGCSVIMASSIGSHGRSHGYMTHQIALAPSVLVAHVIMASSIGSHGMTAYYYRAT